MPNKTIYVSDDDLALLDQAQDLAGGSLSAAVASALRRYVDAESAQQQGFEEVIVRVGPPGSRRKKRFIACRIAQWRRPHGEGRTVEVFSVYRTRRGKYAVYRQDLPIWFAWADPDMRARLHRVAEGMMRRHAHLRHTGAAQRARRRGGVPGPGAEPYGPRHHARRHFGRMPLYGPGEGLRQDPVDVWDWWTSRSEETLAVYDTLEELEAHVPPELAAIVKEQGDEPPLEDLDI